MIIVYSERISTLYRVPCGQNIHREPTPSRQSADTFATAKPFNDLESNKFQSSLFFSPEY